MARLVWIGVGAVGGVYAYRKGERALGAFREQGFVGSVQVVAATAANSAALMRGSWAPAAAATAPPAPAAAPAPPAAGLRVGRFRISRADEAAPTAPPAAIMDTGVLDITDAARRAGTARPRDAQPRRKVR